MLNSFEGILKNGKVELLEIPEGISEARVIVTVLAPARVPAAPHVNLLGFLAGCGVPAGSPDTVSEVLTDLRQERLDRLNRITESAVPGGGQGNT